MRWSSGEHAEADHPPQGGLADQHAGQRAGGVHLVVGEHPHGLQLVGLEQVALVDQHGDAAALVVLGGEQPGGLGDQGGGAVAGPAAQRGDDLVVEAAVPVVGLAR